MHQKAARSSLRPLGSFDSFNPYILRGTAGPVGAVWDTLTRASADEPDTGYAHLAHTIEVAADHTYVAFELRPQARFHDGKPVHRGGCRIQFRNPPDQGQAIFPPVLRRRCRRDGRGPHRAVFHFKTAANRELPQILGQLPVLPKHWWQGREFDAPLTDPPPGLDRTRSAGGTRATW